MKRTRRHNGFTIAELLTCMTITLILISAVGVTEYRHRRNASSLAQCANDVMVAVTAGERWREDVRAAATTPKLDGDTLVIPGKDGDVRYRFADGTVARRSGEAGEWRPVLRNVAASRMLPDPRQRVTSWRWEVELKTRSRMARVTPLFTFLAVPAGKE